MKTAGIIAEYNPLHQGHIYHIEETRRRTGADYVVVAMSGDYVQRGEPAIYHKFLRAQAALRAGADLVLELPSVISTASAREFAMGGVSLLGRLGVVDFLSFGSECGDVDLLEKVADAFDQPPAASNRDKNAREPERVACPSKSATAATSDGCSLGADLSGDGESSEYSALLQKYIKSGMTYPNARARAMEGLGLSPDLCDVLAAPNDILAAEYLRALGAFPRSEATDRQTSTPRKPRTSKMRDMCSPGMRDMRSPGMRDMRSPSIQPVAIERVGDAHDEGTCSSGAIRRHIMEGLPIGGLKSIVPPDVYQMLSNEPPLFPDHFTGLLNTRLSDLAALPDTSAAGIGMPATSTPIADMEISANSTPIAGISHRMAAPENTGKPLLGMGHGEPHTMSGMPSTGKEATPGSIRASHLARILDVSPALANRLLKQSAGFATFTGCIQALKTRGYTYTRISRALLHIALGITDDDLEMAKSLGYAPYAKVLGFRESAAPLLRAIKKKGDIPLITKPAQARRILDPYAYRMFGQSLYHAKLYRMVYHSTYGKNLPSDEGYHLTAFPSSEPAPL
ncbi:MAG: nucleotidyltransferase family protein [Lachnospiraceae bacterium]|jgi:predicted nucleotidyltransferase|nr:nucleotidyltransferase family protein [Lachnospiraceae bacterium]